MLHQHSFLFASLKLSHFMNKETMCSHGLTDECSFVCSSIESIRESDAYDYTCLSICHLSLCRATIASVWLQETLSLPIWREWSTKKMVKCHGWLTHLYTFSLQFGLWWCLCSKICLWCVWLSFCTHLKINKLTDGPPDRTETSKSFSSKRFAAPTLSIAEIEAICSGW